MARSARTATTEPRREPGPAARTLLADLRKGISLRTTLVEESDRVLAGALNGVLWLCGTLTLLPILFVGSVPASHRPLLWVLAGAGIVVGLASVSVIHWRVVPQAFFIVFSLFSVATLALVIWGSGGEQSPARSYLLISILFTAWFYPCRTALLFLVLDLLANGAPLIYDHDAGSANDWLQLLFSTSVFTLVGGSIIAGRALMWMHRVRGDRLAAQDRAMRAITAAVAEGADAEEMYRVAAREVSQLSDGVAAAVLRVDSDQTVTLMGAWPPDESADDLLGTRFPIQPSSKIHEALRTGRPVREDDMTDARIGDVQPFTSGLVAPILLAEHSPFVIVLAARNDQLIGEDQERLMVVGEPIATAIRSLYDRQRLAEQASSDSLTGLSNHRVFTSALLEAVTAALEAELPLSVVLIDVDEFKQINDSAGHEFGDATLVRLARAMRSVARPVDTVSRTGGDEFAWLMPGTPAPLAFEQVEAVRELFQHAPGKHKVTLSAGICDISMATEPNHLTRLADGALYWSKAHGRAQTQVYDPDVVEDLSEAERTERLAHSQTLVGLRALARAIDAKDPFTSQHSERVADIAARLARVSGWPEERIALLRDAALVHDVGKLAIPDALLTKPGVLTARERLQMSEHVELSVRISTGVLSDEQLDWIHSHHERPDGGGYPRGITLREIPLGGQLLAVANAFDAMTSGRGYSRGLSFDEALEECRGRSGTQFGPLAVTALERVLSDSVEGPGLGEFEHTLWQRHRHIPSDGAATARQAPER